MAKNQLDAKTRYTFYKWLEHNQDEFKHKTFIHVLKEANVAFSTTISRGHLTGALKVVPIVLVRSEAAVKEIEADKTRKQIHTLALAVQDLYLHWSEMGEIPNTVKRLVDSTTNGRPK